ncbi:hypothetical protein F5J12DRAFT_786771 [Pisolithus orientalis]|uniref:uncharacterized protein n=1 Tax=Pisolithus orientalis TaxID=936130 RepID=UPI002224B968|nr:uncharacterized protein F5J12DRAFT_786771 [Pisolithus orientalis]KAI5988872.1 hypothetical protein F5J12DRAFT_786771 [Pisolithus orientalis]
MPMVEHCPGSKGLPYKPRDGRFSSCNSPSSSAKVKVEITGVLAEMYGILELSTHTVFNLQHESKKQALATCIAHKYESMAKLYKYKAGSGKARVHKKDMEILKGTVIEHAGSQILTIHLD